jgi:hypothetical protein
MWFCHYTHEDILAMPGFPFATPLTLSPRLNTGKEDRSGDCRTVICQFHGMNVGAFNAVKNDERLANSVHNRGRF